MYSLFKRLRISQELGIDLINELIDNDILYLVNSREAPLKEYSKQKLKKELKYYDIEPKLYFTKPFYRFWFYFVEPHREKKDFINSVISSYEKWGYKLSSLVYEQLSLEILNEYYKKSDKLIEVASFWDVNSEFDLYCKTSSGKYILGECKYKNRPITHSELLKLKHKAQNSNLKVDKFALFSKSGFSQEFYKKRDDNLLLFDLNSLDLITL